MANIITNEGELFRKTAADTVRTFNTVRNGKGSAPRNCFSKEYLDNYDDIFRKSDKKEKDKKSEEPTYKNE